MVTLSTTHRPVSTTPSISMSCPETDRGTERRMWPSPPPTGTTFVLTTILHVPVPSLNSTSRATTTPTASVSPPVPVGIEKDMSTPGGDAEHPPAPRAAASNPAAKPARTASRTAVPTAALASLREMRAISCLSTLATFGMDRTFLLTDLAKVRLDTGLPRYGRISSSKEPVQPPPKAPTLATALEIVPLRNAAASRRHRWLNPGLCRATAMAGPFNAGRFIRPSFPVRLGIPLSVVLGVTSLLHLSSVRSLPYR